MEKHHSSELKTSFRVAESSAFPSVSRRSPAALMDAALRTVLRTAPCRSIDGMGTSIDSNVSMLSARLRSADPGEASCSFLIPARLKRYVLIHSRDAAWEVSLYCRKRLLAIRPRSSSVVTATAPSHALMLLTSSR